MTLVKTTVEPSRVVVRIRVLAGAVTVEAWAVVIRVEAASVVVSPRVVVIKIVLPSRVLVRTSVEAGSVVCCVEMIVEAGSVVCWVIVSRSKDIVLVKTSVLAPWVVVIRTVDAS